jgi:hypothetical protein
MEMTSLFFTGPEVLEHPLVPSHPFPSGFEIYTKFGLGAEINRGCSMVGEFKALNRYDPVPCKV